MMEADVSSDTVRAKWDLERAMVCVLTAAVLHGTWLVWRSARPAVKVCAARMLTAWRVAKCVCCL